MPEDRSAMRVDFRLYLLGLLLSATLTAVPFMAVAAGMGRPGIFWLVGVCGLAQVAVQFRCFLHIGLGRSTRDDLQLILFTILIIGLMVGGTIWILTDLHHRMM